MFVMKVYYKNVLVVNFRQAHSIVPPSYPWVSEDGNDCALKYKTMSTGSRGASIWSCFPGKFTIQLQRESNHRTWSNCIKILSAKRKPHAVMIVLRLTSYPHPLSSPFRHEIPRVQKESIFIRLVTVKPASDKPAIITECGSRFADRTVCSLITYGDSIHAAIVRWIHLELTRSNRTSLLPVPWDVKINPWKNTKETEPTDK